MPSSGEDTRKKRDCNQAKVDTSEEEKPKKVRVDHQPATDNNPSSSAPSIAAVPEPVSAASQSASTARVWDIESALLYLTQIEGDFKEHLDHEQSAWVTFRVGHAGDASTIANWYRQNRSMEEHDEDEDPELEKQRVPIEEAEETTSSMLEVWLADGMGNDQEGNPPSVYCLVADVHKPSDSDASGSSLTTKTSTVSFGAVALLTIAFADNERILRVEWMGMDPELSSNITSTLSQRMWLRLSTLSVMTACQLVSVDKQVTLSNEGKEESFKSKILERLHPSAE